MAITVSCPGCGSSFKVAVQFVGKRAKCAKCGDRFIIPEPPEEDEVVLGDLDWQSPVAIPVSLPPTPPPPSQEVIFEEPQEVIFEESPPRRARTIAVNLIVSIAVCYGLLVFVLYGLGVIFAIPKGGNRTTTSSYSSVVSLK